jgi:hypothetical protein
MLMLNEGKVCEAIVRQLEAREGTTRADVQRPDEANRRTAAVELTWWLGSQLYALEHTAVEPFDDYMRMTNEGGRHYDPILAALQTGLPPDVFELHVPAMALVGCNKLELPKIQAAIIAWVRETGPALKVRRYKEYKRHEPWIDVPGVPFGLRLYRFDTLPAIGGRFHIAPIVNGDTDRDRARSERIERACNKKFPKLAECKRASGAHTVLVLEDNDMMLTNYARVA